MPLDFGITDLRQRSRFPARLVVFVDNHRADALVKIVTSDHARDYAEFRLHAHCEAPLFAAANLGERELETEWRFGSNIDRRSARPFCMLAGFGIEHPQDFFDAVADEQTINDIAACENRTLFYRLGKSCDYGIARIETLTGQRAIDADLARHARQKPGRADVRKKPDSDFRHRKLIPVA